MADTIKPQTWTDFCQLRWTNRENVHSRMGKVKVEEFLLENNFPFSRILKKFDDPKKICLDNLPECFVLKPSNLWSAKGVMLLRKIGADLYKEDMTNEFLTSKNIIEYSIKLEKEANRNFPFLIEERAIDEDTSKAIPLDYKFFTFNGNVRFILQVDRNYKKPKIAFFDGDFFPINDERVFVPKGKKDTLGKHRKPDCYLELIELASEISRKLKSPFVSIDCYATKNGPLFGELTHTPGGPWFGTMYLFSKEFDRELGFAWEKAARELDIEVPVVESNYSIFLKGKLVRKVDREHS